MRKYRLLWAIPALLIGLHMPSASAAPPFTYVYVYGQYSCKNNSTGKVKKIYVFTNVFGICGEYPEFQSSVDQAKGQDFSASQNARTKCPGGDVTYNWMLEGAMSHNSADTSAKRDKAINDVIQKGIDWVTFEVPSPYSRVCR
jgi:hypothetical protein